MKWPDWLKDLFAGQPYDPGAPEAPPEPPAPATPAPPPALPEAAAPAPVPGPKTVLGSIGIPSIDKWDFAFAKASLAVETARGVRVDPRVLKAMMKVESGGNGDYPPERCRPSDGYDAVPACGPMQIKFPYHEHKCPRCDLTTVPGQLELAAHILGAHMAGKPGRTEEDAILAVYFPGADANGTTQQAYLNEVRRLVAVMERDAAATATTTTTTTTTRPPVAAPVDPISVILGGRSYPPIDYGWLADAGLPYYQFGVGHGTSTATQHTGVDVAVPEGTPLHAPAPGVVRCVGSAGSPDWGQACGSYADEGGGPGNITIMLDNVPGQDRLKLTLGHCRSATVKPGDRVAAGQRVGTSGRSNGPHLHLETSVRRANTYWLVDPVPALANLIRAQGGVGTTPSPKGPTLDVEIAIADGAGSNRPRTKLDGDDLWLTIHETGNPSPTADARMHRDFVNRGGGSDRVSFHFAVDRERAVQILPLDEVGFHAGDGCDSRPDDTGCFRSVAIETCVNDPAGSAGWERTKRNLAALIAGLVTDPSRFRGGAGKRFAFDRIAEHHRWSGKDCPARMRAEGSLPAVVETARGIAAGGTPVPTTLPPEPPAKRFPVALPDKVVSAIFVGADPEGPVTKEWMAKGCPPFVQTVDLGHEKYWVFTTLILRSKDGVVEEVVA